MRISGKLVLSSKQCRLFGGKIEPFQILPEYYVLKVNNFNDVARDSLEEWIYYLKNNEIKEEFSAKGMDKARELWRIDSLPGEERKRYLRYIDNLHYHTSMAWSMMAEAEYDFKMERTLEIAKKLKKNGAPTDTIIKSTGLSKEEIENL